jgi:hypothetical protein
MLARILSHVEALRTFIFQEPVENNHDCRVLTDPISSDGWVGWRLKIPGSGDGSDFPICHQKILAD